jgi:predicted HAD superfamily Cof-like phosphohydrolase
MEKASQKRPDTPTMPLEEVRLLRATLILEEALETIHALGVCVEVKAGNMGWFDVSMDGHPLRLAHSIIAPDLEAIADGCADLSVVNIGTLIACGIKDERLLQEVDENNLRKFRHVCPKCRREYEGVYVNDAVAAFTPKEGKIAAPGMMKCVTCGTEWCSGYRREDGKWVKPENHRPPNIEGVLQEQGYDAEESEAEGDVG